MATRPLPARMAVIPERARMPVFHAEPPRVCDDPARVPGCWLRPCARCGGETAVAMDPGCEVTLWLCADPECGAATNEDGVAVDIAPAAWAGTDTARDHAHEMAEDRAHDRAHEQAQRDNPHGYL